MSAVPASELAKARAITKGMKKNPDSLMFQYIHFYDVKVPLSIPLPMVSVVANILELKLLRKLDVSEELSGRVVSLTWNEVKGETFHLSEEARKAIAKQASSEFYELIEKGVDKLTYIVGYGIVNKENQFINDKRIFWGMSLDNAIENGAKVWKAEKD